jgi:hypothetical protein
MFTIVYISTMPTIFAEWFKTTWQRPGESETTAIARAQGETGIAALTWKRALRGSRVRLDSAERISAFTGGAVTIESLVIAPTLREVRTVNPTRRGRPRATSVPPEAA